MAYPSPPHVVSIGYEGRSVAELIQVLRTQHVSVLVDLRLTPISRKPGLSKTALAQALASAGIGYVHQRDLGNPKANRAGYRAGASESIDAYGEILSSIVGRTALRHVSELFDEGVVALLCFERNHEECHRQQVLEELDAMCAGLQVSYA